MITNLPYETYINEWDGDGPSMGAGGSDSDPRYGGEQTMDVVSVSLQYVHTLVPPRPNTYIDMMAGPQYPTDDVEFAQPRDVATLAPRYDYQDTVMGGIVGDDYAPDLTLQAPAIPLGGTIKRKG